MNRRGRKLLRAGDKVSAMTRCENMHLWVLHGTVTDDNAVSLGSFEGQPNEQGKDPTVCAKCGGVMVGHYGWQREEATA